MLLNIGYCVNSICNAKKEFYTLFWHVRRNLWIIKTSSNLKMCLHMSLLYFKMVIIIVIQRWVITVILVPLGEFVT